jgi:plasmid stabilization system protein ParE
MTYVLRFLPEVESDLHNGRSWYEERSPGLGDAFIQAFYACAQDLLRFPRQCQKVHRDFRRHLFRRFPYALYYRVIEDQIVVFGAFHAARDPRRLQKELGDRTLPS